MTNNFNKNTFGKKMTLFIFLTAIFLGFSSMIQEEIKGNLVRVDWLKNKLKNTDVVILDASPAQTYAAKHIPGALNHDIFTYGARELPATEIEKRYQSWGISPGKKIVIYDQGGSMLATRLFFSLEYYGFPTKDLFILDGGLAAWLDAGFPVTSESTPSPKIGSFTINKLRNDSKADLPEFVDASGDTKNNVLLEALDPNWHFGAFNFFERPGHIPNAIMLPVADFYNPDKTFKSAEEIKMMLTYLGIKPEQNVYSHCGGGIAASVPFFALKYLLGYSHVKLFIGSELEWASDPRELPFWTYDAPFLMRNASWLQSWGGTMMRMYGISHVSFVDIRSTGEFNQGHIQFALNIPAGVFKNNISNPDKLAEELGSAGVNASHEALIISGGGLTKEAALAFVMLEKIGQKKISVFLGPVDRWAHDGFTMIKDTIAENVKIASQDLSGHTAAYPVDFRLGIIIETPNATQGIYPKVFIASGINTPAQTPEGKVVHIPFTDLLNTDGTPKAAKDIWNVLASAGITRYGELICFSDDPGEAAINYFILKLMGFPDIKVLKL